MVLKEFNDVMLPAVEAELNKQISRLVEPTIQPLREMLFISYGLVRGRISVLRHKENESAAFIIAYLCILRCRLED